MHAVVLREFGGPDVLRLETVEDPVAEPGWIDVRGGSTQLARRAGSSRKVRISAPARPGCRRRRNSGRHRRGGSRFAVVLVGADESAPAPGWQILGDHQRGTYAELVRVPVDCVAPKPEGLSWEQAAALPLVGITTYRALFSRGRLRSGESLLVLGAGGGVATMAVLLASAFGVTVTVTSSTYTKIAQAKEMGAADGVLYSDPDWATAAREFSPGGRGFDVVLDSVGTWSQSVTALRPGGRLVVLGASRSDTATLDVRPFHFGQFELIGTTMGSPRDFAGLLSLLEANSVAPVPISAKFPLAEAAAAHKYLESGSGFGKVVFTHG